MVVPTFSVGLYIKGEEVTTVPNETVDVWNLHVAYAGKEYNLHAKSDGSLELSSLDGLLTMQPVMGNAICFKAEDRLHG